MLFCQQYRDGWLNVKADFPNSKPGIAVSLGIAFGAAGWLALFLHMIGVEIYLHLTPRENERLRVISYQRQLEAGFSHPGRLGLTSDRLGDRRTVENWQSMVDQLVEMRDREIALV